MRLTTTSYAVLGLLVLRPAGSYELTQRAKRNISLIWPRGETRLYAEPKRLAQLGLVRAERGHVGRRPRTIYSVTAKGRRALRMWLDTPCAPPALEFEAGVRAMCAIEVGTRTHLLTAIGEARRAVDATRAKLALIAADQLEGRARFPERSHFSAVMAEFLRRYLDAIRGWAMWAEAEVTTWEDLGPEGKGPLVREVFSRLAKQRRGSSRIDVVPGATLHSQSARSRTPRRAAGQLGAMRRSASRSKTRS
jgi:DNA-binding PadR family transcriptional regulator